MQRRHLKIICIKELKVCEESIKKCEKIGIYPFNNDCNVFLQYSV